MGAAENSKLLTPTSVKNEISLRFFFDFQGQSEIEGEDRCNRGPAQNSEGTTKTDEILRGNRKS